MIYAQKYYRGLMRTGLLAGASSCATSWKEKKTKLDFDSGWQWESNYKVTDRQTTKTLNTNWENGNCIHGTGHFFSFLFLFYTWNLFSYSVQNLKTHAPLQGTSLMRWAKRNPPFFRLDQCKCKTQTFIAGFLKSFKILHAWVPVTSSVKAYAWIALLKTCSLVIGVNWACPNWFPSKVLFSAVLKHV